MNHSQAVNALKGLPKNTGWSAAEAISIIECLDRSNFTRASDYAEAVTAAIIGQRWESVHGRQGYDTASRLFRWLGRGAIKHGNPEVIFDAKTQRSGIGYSEKVAERASKATDYLNRREVGGVINGVIFHTPHGMFFQLGMDHKSTRPRFGKGKRAIHQPKDLPRLVDGQGGILTAVLLSSEIKWNGDRFDGLDELSVQEVIDRLASVLKTLLEGVDMEKLQKHLDNQAKQAVAQATEKMLKNKTARAIVTEKILERPEALEIVAAEVSEEHWERMVKARKAARAKKSGGR